MSAASALILLVLWASLLPAATHAQTLEQPAAGYVLKRWTTADGLPHDTIQTLLQARDGYLWIGTTNAGLVRFDGLRFTTFNILNTPSLESNAVGALYEDADGTLWIGSGPGLVRYRDGVFTTESFPDGMAPGAIADVRADRDGKLWVAGQERVVRRDDRGWSLVIAERTGFQPLFAAPDGAMWIATGRGLIEWRGRVVRTLTMADGLPSSTVYTALQDRSGRLWLGTTAGLAHIDLHRPGARVERSILTEMPTTALFEDEDGALWIGGNDGLFVRRAGGTLDGPIVGGGGNRSSGIRAVTADREGHLWFGIAGGIGGLYRLTPRHVTTITQRDGLPCDNVGPITQAPDGAIWLASLCANGQGVVAIRDGNPTRYDGPMYVASLLAEADGAVWAGTYTGRLYRLVEGRFVDVPVPARDGEDDVASIYRDATGVLWLGTSNGLLKGEDGRWTYLRTGDGLVGNDVRVVTGDRHGALWIGTALGVSRYHQGRFTNYDKASGVPPGPVRAIYVDADDVVWIGTYGGGLARLANGTIAAFGEHGGLLDTSVHRILEDDEGALWLTGDRGIRRVAKQELSALAQDRATVLSVLVYTEAEGMLSAECNGMGQPAGWRMRDGTFYFPTQRGAVRVDPGALRRHAPPLVPHVESVLVDRAPASIAAPLDVPAGTRDIEIRYTAPAFARPELVQFRYRLNGYDADWVDVGPRRSASFGNLKPRRYEFSVAARTGGGPWSERTATVTFVLHPFFYQRISVQIALGLSVLVLGGLGARWYGGRLRRRAAELERAVVERTSELSAAHEDLSAAHERLSVVNQDLTDAKREVEQAHGQLLAVLDQLDIGVLVLGASGIVRYASASAQRVLGKDEYALLGQSWATCLPLVETDRLKIKERVEGRSAPRGRVPVQAVIGGARYWMEIDVRDEPPPGDGRLLYMYSVAEMSGRPGEAGSTGLLGMVGRSTAMHVVYKQIRDVARVDSTVLIEGETGVGKELVARAIHRESRRADKPFVAVNAAGLSESLVASQLFGHRRGAFTGAVDDQIGVFEAANGGTVFLDEIGDMPPSVQVSLLRVVQEREVTRLGESQPRRVDVRFLAATHRDLVREVEAGRFREDLLYRVRVATIVVPPLRERIDDVPLLVEAFVAEAARHGQRAVAEMSREAMDALMRYQWPGNVRELKAAIERALMNTPGDLLRRDDLPSAIVVAAPPAQAESQSDRDRIVDALRRANGNRTEAARLLAIGRTTLYRRLREYGLDDTP